MAEEIRNLLISPSAAALAKNPDVTSVRIDPADPNFQKSEYTLYKLVYELVINVPAGEEFAARELTFTTEEGKTVRQAARQKSFCIRTVVDSSLDITFLSSPKVNCIILEHASGRDGLNLAPLDKFPEMPGYCELEIL